MHANESLGVGGVVGGLCLLASAGSAALAWAHMRAIEQMGVICGATPEPHCGWCASALVLGLFGVALVAGTPRIIGRRILVAAKRPTTGERL